MKNSNVPEIRFPGFTGAWEQRKFSELVEQVVREVPKPNKPYYRMSVRSHAKGTFKQFVDNPDKIAMDKLFVVRKDDLVVNITFAWEHAIAIVPEENDGLLVSHRFPTYRADGKSDIKFLNYLVSKEDFRRKLEFISPGGAGRNRVLNKKDFLALKILVPKLINEQSKIGAIFKQLDDTITLHQQELTTLKKTKQGFLQKMFPKEGERVPEIRFPGFTDSWEQRKLKDVTERVRGNDGRMDLPTLTISAGRGWLDQRERFSGNIAGKEQKNYTLLKKGQLSYNHGNSKLAKYGAVFELRTYEEALVPRVYHSFETNELAIPDFIEYMFATKLPDRELGKLVSSGARMDGLLNINFDEFMGIKIMTPSCEEQKKIGSFFKQLDDTIALHQRELEILQETKKAFLQKMFV